MGENDVIARRLNTIITEAEALQRNLNAIVGVDHVWAYDINFGNPGTPSEYTEHGIVQADNIDDAEQAVAQRSFTNGGRSYLIYSVNQLGWTKQGKAKVFVMGMS